MAEFHFVEDYQRLVTKLVKVHGLDEGMSLAVGGAYEKIGEIEADILIEFGLRDGMKLADVGCGSGRTATALGRRLNVEYDGFDIVREFLVYAATKAPKNYNFILNRDIRLPSSEGVYDMVCAFSLFTHLLHEETFIYITDIYRTLKPQGALALSFLEFAAPTHWPIFVDTVEGAKRSSRPHLNMFIERNVIEIMAAKVGFSNVKFYDATTTISHRGALGQSVALLTKSQG